MPDNFLSLTEKLAATTSPEEKKELSARLSSFLAEDKEFASLVLHSLALNVMKSVPALVPVLTSEFFQVRHAVYRDMDGQAKVAMGVAYLQDFQEPDEKLDGVVLQALLRELEARNLDLLVNDVTVNLLQLRDSSSESLL